MDSGCESPTVRVLQQRPLHGGFGHDRTDGGAGVDTVKYYTYTRDDGALLVSEFPFAKRMGRTLTKASTLSKNVENLGGGECNDPLIDNGQDNII